MTLGCSPDRIGRAVMNAWSMVLRGGPSPPDSPFHAVGGDSLTFLRLVMSVEEDLGVSIPLDAVSMEMSADQLAAAIAGVVQSLSTDGIAPRDAGGPRPVVFMIPVAGGDGPGQARLRAGCADGLDIQCVDLPHWSVIAQPGYTFESLCDSLVDQILARAGGTPILLAGYCFGGALASVVARKLLDQGHQVGFLGLIDADVTWFRRPQPLRQPGLSQVERMRAMRWAWQTGRLAEQVAWYAAEILERRGRVLLRWLGGKGRHRLLPEPLRFHLNLHLQMVLLPRTDRSGLVRLMRSSSLAHIPTTVFRSDAHDADRPDDLGWSELFAPVEVVAIGGDHAGVFEPVAISGLVEAFTGAVATVIGQRHPGAQNPPRNPVATT